MPDIAPYKIFDYCWDVPYQFDMINSLRSHCQFDYCLNSRTHWDPTQRPVPPHLTFVSHYEHGQYDFAILHIDQQIGSSDDRQLKIYKQLDDYIDDIPKIVVNHGSPVLPEAKAFVRSIVGNNTMVVNSYPASCDNEWGFGIPMIHGMDSNDWWDLPKEPRAFTALPVQEIKEAGETLYYQHGFLTRCANYNVPSFDSFDDYRNYLGRSLIYLTAPARGPMHRARTEALLSGCCVVQVQGDHTIDHWAKDGENLVLVPDDPPAIAAVIADLLENRYEEALQIGQNGKKIAIQLFNRDRYRNDWLHLFKTLKSGRLK